MTIQEIREMRKTKSRLDDTINKLYNLFAEVEEQMPKDFAIDKQIIDREGNKWLQSGITDTSI